MISDVWSFIASGGFVMPPLAVATVVLWYALGWRMVTLGRPNANRMLREAKAMTDQASRALVAASEADRRARFDELVHPYRVECQKWSATIRTIVIVAPLAGLLGTVAGMIETFDALGSMSLFSQSGGIAGGISQALITTQMGLAVAIPGLVVGRLLDRRADELVERLETP